MMGHLNLEMIKNAFENDCKKVTFGERLRFDQVRWLIENVEEQENKIKEPKYILKNPPGINIEELKKLMHQPMPIMVSEPFEIEHLDLDYIKKELEAASNYIAENEVIHKKFKKNIPTVIEYQGRKYILEPQAVNKHAKD